MTTLIQHPTYFKEEKDDKEESDTSSSDTNRNSSRSLQVAWEASAQARGCRAKKIDGHGSWRQMLLDFQGSTFRRPSLFLCEISFPRNMMKGGSLFA